MLQNDLLTMMDIKPGDKTRLPCTSLQVIAWNWVNATTLSLNTHCPGARLGFHARKILFAGAIGAHLRKNVWTVLFHGLFWSNISIISNFCRMPGWLMLMMGVLAAAGCPSWELPHPSPSHVFPPSPQLPMSGEQKDERQCSEHSN